jgi:acid phosphatase (class A)
MFARANTAAALSALLLLATAAAAAEPAAPTTAAVAAPKPMKSLKVLTPDQVDPARLLPAPPADGSEAQKADLAEVQRLYRIRSPERLAQAQWDDTHETSALFAGVIGPGFDLTRLPRTAELLKLVENEQAVSATIAKKHFLRNRPWAIDPSLKACDYKEGANPKTSYPSGHATLGYSVGLILANLMPEKSEAILSRAADYAYSREICAAHYASDTEASHVLGTVVALQLLASPQVAPMLEASRAELRAAHLTGEGALAQVGAAAPVR